VVRGVRGSPACIYALLMRLARFVYQVVVPRALAAKELVRVFDSGEQVVLPPWNPMVRFCSLRLRSLMDGLCRVPLLESGLTLD
jgi:hypothetical protein